MFNDANAVSHAAATRRFATFATVARLSTNFAEQHNAARLSNGPSLVAGHAANKRSARWNVGPQTGAFLISADAVDRKEERRTGCERLTA